MSAKFINNSLGDNLESLGKELENIIVEDQDEPKTTNVAIDPANSFETENTEETRDDEEKKFINNETQIEETPQEQNNKKRVIGIKSVTPGAGATTLTYLMKKQLEKKYNVLAIEVEKRDFIYFNDKELLSLSNGIIGETLTTNNDKDVILVDLFLHRNNLSN